MDTTTPTTPPPAAEPIPTPAPPVTPPASTPAPEAAASTPTPAPAAKPAAAPAQEELDVSPEAMKSFLDAADAEEGDEGESGEETPPAAPVPAAQPAQPGEAAATATPPVAPTPTPPTQEAQKPPEPVQPAKPTPEPQPELTPEQVHQRFKQWRDQGVDLLANQHYNLQPDQVKEIVDPETGMVNGEKLAKTVSRVASQVYMDVVTAAMGQMVQHMPALIDRVLQARNQGAAIEGKFFEQWPQLKDHKDVVIRLGQVFRQQNPRATVDDFIKEVGASAMIALRLGVPTPAASVPQPQAQRPFKPAAASRPATPPPTAKPKNPFEMLAEADLKDDMTVEDME